VRLTFPQTRWFQRREEVAYSAYLAFTHVLAFVVAEATQFFQSQLVENELVIAAWIRNLFDDFVGKGKGLYLFQSILAL
jgi:hypothetical protein